MAFIVSTHEGEEIKQGRKFRTLRPIKANGKGYFRVGSLQRVYTSRDFTQSPICRVLVTDRGFTDTTLLTDVDSPALGYTTISEYLAQPYNQTNPSTERVVYTFVELNELYTAVADSEIDPENFAYFYDLCKGERELIRGITPSLVYEGCDLEDLEAEYLTLQGNIYEAII